MALRCPQPERPMSTRDSASPTLRDLVRAVFRFRWRALLFAIGVVVLTGIGLSLAPRTYESEARLFVRVGRQNATLDPFAASGDRISMFESRESEMNSLLNILSSRTLLERVVDRMGVETIQGGKQEPADDNYSQFAAVMSNALNEAKAMVSTPLAPREKLIIDLQAAVEIDAPRKSNSITIRTEWKSPELAQEITAALLDEYSREHLQAHRAGGALTFFREQEATARLELQEAEDELRQLKNAARLASVGGGRDLIHAQLGRLDGDILAAESEEAAVTAAVEQLRAQVAELPERLDTEQTRGANAALDELIGQMFQLHVREKELAAKYEDSHPELAAVREQIAEAQKLVATFPEERTQNVTAMNPVRQRLDEQLRLQRATQSGLLARLEQLQRERIAANARLEKMNQAEMEIVQLERRIAVLQDNHRSYAGKLEQARIDDALEKEQISNVNIVQPATLEPRPVSPKRTLIMALAAGLAVFGGLAVAIGSDWLDPSVRRVDQLQEALGAPVLSGPAWVGGSPLVVERRS